MKHAGPAALDHLEPLLRALRKIEGLKEKSRGVFYRSGKAFLHFHEHGDEFYADVRLASDFELHPVNKRSERTILLKKVKAALKC